MATLTFWLSETESIRTFQERKVRLCMESPKDQECKQGCYLSDESIATDEPNCIPTEPGWYSPIDSNKKRLCPSGTYSDENTDKTEARYGYCDICPPEIEDASQVEQYDGESSQDVTIGAGGIKICKAPPNHVPTQSPLSVSENPPDHEATSAPVKPTLPGPDDSGTSVTNPLTSHKSTLPPVESPTSSPEDPGTIPPNEEDEPPQPPVTMSNEDDDDPSSRSSLCTVLPFLSLSLFIIVI